MPITKSYPEKTQSSKMNRVEEILQKHLENFTRIILMEECTSKVCCVKLKKLSHKESNNLNHDKETNKRKLSRKKCMKRRQKHTTSHNVNINNGSKKNIYVSSLTLTTPRIRKKSSVHNDSNTTKSVEPDCLIDEFLNDPADNIPSHSKDNTPLKFLRKQPVIIQFSKQKPSRNIGTALDGNLTKCSTNVHQGEGCKDNQTRQDNKISCYNPIIDGLPIVSTGPPCAPNILQYNSHCIDGHNRDPLTGLQIDYKHNVLKHRKIRSIQRKRRKERWSFKREASSSIDFVFSRKQPYLKNALYHRSTKIPVIVSGNDLEVECHPFKPITDQELNDGLPDIPMLT